MLVISRKDFPQYTFLRAWAIFALFFWALSGNVRARAQCQDTFSISSGTLKLNPALKTATRTQPNNLIGYSVGVWHDSTYHMQTLTERAVVLDTHNKKEYEVGSLLIQSKQRMSTQFWGWFAGHTVAVLQVICFPEGASLQDNTAIWMHEYAIDLTNGKWRVLTAGSYPGSDDSHQNNGLGVLAANKATYLTWTRHAYHPENLFQLRSRDHDDQLSLVPLQARGHGCLVAQSGSSLICELQGDRIGVFDSAGRQMGKSYGPGTAYSWAPNGSEFVFYHAIDEARTYPIRVWDLSRSRSDRLADYPNDPDVDERSPVVHVIGPSQGERFLHITDDKYFIDATDTSSWRQDGKWFFTSIVRKALYNQIVAFPVGHQSTRWTRISSPTMNARYPSVSPDGKELIFLGVDTSLSKDRKLSPVQIYKASIRELPKVPEKYERLTSVPFGYAPLLPAWSELSSVPFNPFAN